MQTLFQTAQSAAALPRFLRYTILHLVQTPDNLLDATLHSLKQISNLLSPFAAKNYGNRAEPNLTTSKNSTGDLV